MRESPPKVITIPAKPEVASRQAVQRQLRVAAYCRVSTDDEEQLTSYEAQQNYYTDKIMTNREWTMAGIFADEGITGTSARKRPEFLKMIRLCKQKKIEILLPTWIQSHDSFENEPPFEYPLNPLFSNRYQHRKRSEPLTFISCPEHFLC